MADVTQNITNYMNGFGNRQYTRDEASHINNAIRQEYNLRLSEGMQIPVKTQQGRNLLNQRIAALANNNIGREVFVAADIFLYKKCRAEEYSHRTGKCAWGFKSKRIRDGYDPITGMEII